MTTQNIDLVSNGWLPFGDPATAPNTALNMSSMAGGASGDYRQSAKKDLGSPFSEVYHAYLIINFLTAPTAGGTLDLFVGFSDSAVAGTNNWGNCSGVDGAYTGYAGGTAASGVLQLDRVGALVVSPVAGQQIGLVGSFIPRAQYMYLVIYNNTSLSTIAGIANHKLILLPVTARVEAPV